MRLYIDKDDIILDFPFDQGQVNEIKRISGARWDKVSRVWRLPLTSLNEGREFALKHKFEVSIGAMKFSATRRIGSSRVFSKNGLIYMRFPYERVMVKAVKQIPAVSWDASQYSWTAPIASVKNVIEWARSFDLGIDADIEAVALQVRSEMDVFVKASRSVDAEIDVPDLKGTLLPYQRAGVAYAAKARRCFIADEMGLGKTIQAIATLEYSGQSYPAIVVCPPSLVLNWAVEYQKWLPSRRVATVTNRKSFPDEGTYDVCVLGYSNLAHWEKERKVTGHQSYVFDESHYAKTPTAQRTKAAIRAVASAPKDGMVLCLTGTPVTNRPAEYASQLDILGQLKQFGGLWGFYRRYCAAYQDSFGVWNISGHSHLDELNDRLRSLCYIRRTKDQVLSELPPVIHSKVVIEGDPASMKEYKKAEKDIVLYIAQRARELAREQGKSPHGAGISAMIRAEANEHLVRLSVLRRLAAKAKMESAIEWITAHIEDGKKVVVAAHHRDIVDELARKFSNLRIQGGMSVEDVEDNKKKFQELPVDKAPVIVLSIQAGKTGHTLTASQDCLFVELAWTPADIDQTYSRLHRIGQKGSVTATYLITHDTIDEDIYRLIESKRSVVNASVDGVDVDSEGTATQLILNLIDKVNAQTEQGR